MQSYVQSSRSSSKQRKRNVKNVLKQHGEEFDNLNKFEYFGSNSSEKPTQPTLSLEEIKEGLPSDANKATTGRHTVVYADADLQQFLFIIEKYFGIKLHPVWNDLTEEEKLRTPYTHLQTSFTSERVGDSFNDIVNPADAETGDTSAENIWKPQFPNTVPFDSFSGAHTSAQSVSGDITMGTREEIDDCKTGNKAESSVSNPGERDAADRIAEYVGGSSESRSDGMMSRSARYGYEYNMLISSAVLENRLPTNNADTSNYQELLGRTFYGNVVAAKAVAKGSVENKFGFEDPEMDGYDEDADEYFEGETYKDAEGQSLGDLRRPVSSSGKKNHKHAVADSESESFSDINLNKKTVLNSTSNFSRNGLGIPLHYMEACLPQFTENTLNINFNPCKSSPADVETPVSQMSSDKSTQKKKHPTVYNPIHGWAEIIDGSQYSNETAVEKVKKGFRTNVLSLFTVPGFEKLSPMAFGTMRKNELLLFSLRRLTHVQVQRILVGQSIFSSSASSYTLNQVKNKINNIRVLRKSFFETDGTVADTNYNEEFFESGKTAYLKKTEDVLTSNKDESYVNSNICSNSIIDNEFGLLEFPQVSGIPVDNDITFNANATHHTNNNITSLYQPSYYCNSTHNPSALASNAVGNAYVPDSIQLQRIKANKKPKCSYFFSADSSSFSIENSNAMGLRRSYMYKNYGAYVAPLSFASMPLLVREGLLLFEEFVQYTNERTVGFTVEESDSAIAKKTVSAAKSIDQQFSQRAYQPSNESSRFLIENAPLYFFLLHQLLIILQKHECYELLIRIINIASSWRFSKAKIRNVFLKSFLNSVLPSNYCPLIELMLVTYENLIYNTLVVKSKTSSVFRAHQLELYKRSHEWMCYPMKESLNGSCSEPLSGIRVTGETLWSEFHKISNLVTSGVLLNYLARSVEFSGISRAKFFSHTYNLLADAFLEECRRGGVLLCEDSSIICQAIFESDSLPGSSNSFHNAEIDELEISQSQYFDSRIGPLNSFTSITEEETDVILSEATNLFSSCCFKSVGLRALLVPLCHSQKELDFPSRQKNSVDSCAPAASMLYCADILPFTTEDRVCSSDMTTSRVISALMIYIHMLRCHHGVVFESISPSRILVFPRREETNGFSKGYSENQVWINNNTEENGVDFGMSYNSDLDNKRILNHFISRSPGFERLNLHVKSEKDINAAEDTIPLIFINTIWANPHNLLLNTIMSLFSCDHNVHHRVRDLAAEIVEKTITSLLENCIFKTSELSDYIKNTALPQRKYTIKAINNSFLINDTAFEIVYSEILLPLVLVAVTAITTGIATIPHPYNSILNLNRDCVDTKMTSQADILNVKPVENQNYSVSGNARYEANVHSGAVILGAIIIAYRRFIFENGINTCSTDLHAEKILKSILSDKKKLDKFKNVNSEELKDKQVRQSSPNFDVTISSSTHSLFALAKQKPASEFLAADVDTKEGAYETFFASPIISRQQLDAVFQVITSPPFQESSLNEDVGNKNFNLNKPQYHSPFLKHLLLRLFPSLAQYQLDFYTYYWNIISNNGQLNILKSHIEHQYLEKNCSNSLFYYASRAIGCIINLSDNKQLLVRERALVMVTAMNIITVLMLGTSGVYEMLTRPSSEIDAIYGFKVKNDCNITDNSLMQKILIVITQAPRNDLFVTALAAMLESVSSNINKIVINSIFITDAIAYHFKSNNAPADTFSQMSLAVKKRYAKLVESFVSTANKYYFNRNRVHLELTRILSTALPLVYDAGALNAEFVIAISRICKEYPLLFPNANNLLVGHLRTCLRRVAPLTLYYNKGDELSYETQVVVNNCYSGSVIDGYGYSILDYLNDDYGDPVGMLGGQFDYDLFSVVNTTKKNKFSYKLKGDAWTNENHCYKPWIMSELPLVLEAKMSCFYIMQMLPTPAKSALSSSENSIRTIVWGSSSPIYRSGPFVDDIHAKSFEDTINKDEYLNENFTQQHSDNDYKISLPQAENQAFTYSSVPVALSNLNRIFDKKVLAVDDSLQLSLADHLCIAPGTGWWYGSASFFYKFCLPYFTHVCTAIRFNAVYTSTQVLMMDCYSSQNSLELVNSTTSAAVMRCDAFCVEADKNQRLFDDKAVDELAVKSGIDIQLMHSGVNHRFLLGRILEQIMRVVAADTNEDVRLTALLCLCPHYHALVTELGNNVITGDKVRLLPGTFGEFFNEDDDIDNGKYDVKKNIESKEGRVENEKRRQRYIEYRSFLERLSISNAMHTYENVDAKLVNDSNFNNLASDQKDIDKRVYMFDQFLCSDESALNTLFTLINDESHRVAMIAIITIKRIGVLNPALILPQLTKLLMVILRQMYNSVSTLEDKNSQYIPFSLPTVSMYFRMFAIVDAITQIHHCKSRREIKGLTLPEIRVSNPVHMYLSYILWFIAAVIKRIDVTAWTRRIIMNGNSSLFRNLNKEGVKKSPWVGQDDMNSSDEAAFSQQGQMGKITTEATAIRDINNSITATVVMFNLLVYLFNECCADETDWLKFAPFIVITANYLEQLNENSTALETNNKMMKVSDNTDVLGRIASQTVGLDTLTQAHMPYGELEFDSGDFSDEDWKTNLRHIKVIQRNSDFSTNSQLRTRLDKEINMNFLEGQSGAAMHVDLCPDKMRGTATASDIRMLNGLSGNYTSSVLNTPAASPLITLSGGFGSTVSSIDRLIASKYLSNTQMSSRDIDSSLITKTPYSSMQFSFRSPELLFLNKGIVFTTSMFNGEGGTLSMNSWIKYRILPALEALSTISQVAFVYTSMEEGFEENPSIKGVREISKNDSELKKYLNPEVYRNVIKVLRNFLPQQYYAITTINRVLLTQVMKLLDTFSSLAEDYVETIYTGAGKIPKEKVKGSSLHNTPFADLHGSFNLRNKISDFGIWSNTLFSNQGRKNLVFLNYYDLQNVFSPNITLGFNLRRLVRIMQSRNVFDVLSDQKEYNNMRTIPFEIFMSLLRILITQISKSRVNHSNKTETHNVEFLADKRRGRIRYYNNDGVCNTTAENPYDIDIEVLKRFNSNQRDSDRNKRESLTMSEVNTYVAVFKACAATAEASTRTAYSQEDAADKYTLYISLIFEVLTQVLGITVTAGPLIRAEHSKSNKHSFLHMLKKWNSTSKEDDCTQNLDSASNMWKYKNNPITHYENAEWRLGSEHALQIRQSSIFSFLTIEEVQQNPALWLRSETFRHLLETCRHLVGVYVKQSLLNNGSEIKSTAGSSITNSTLVQRSGITPIKIEICFSSLIKLVQEYWDPNIMCVSIYMSNIIYLINETVNFYALQRIRDIVGCNKMLDKINEISKNSLYKDSRLSNDSAHWCFMSLVSALSHYSRDLNCINSRHTSSTVRFGLAEYLDCAEMTSLEKGIVNSALFTMRALRSFYTTVNVALLKISDKNDLCTLLGPNCSDSFASFVATVTTNTFISGDNCNTLLLSLVPVLCDIVSENINHIIITNAALLLQMVVLNCSANIVEPLIPRIIDCCKQRLFHSLVFETNIDEESVPLEEPFADWQFDIQTGEIAEENAENEYTTVKVGTPAGMYRNYNSYLDQIRYFPQEDYLDNSVGGNLRNTIISAVNAIQAIISCDRSENYFLERTRRLAIIATFENIEQKKEKLLPPITALGFECAEGREFLEVLRHNLENIILSELPLFTHEVKLVIGNFICAFSKLHVTPANVYSQLIFLLRESTSVSPIRSAKLYPEKRSAQVSPMLRMSSAASAYYVKPHDLFSKTMTDGLEFHFDNPFDVAQSAPVTPLALAENQEISSFFKIPDTIDTDFSSADLELTIRDIIIKAADMIKRHELYRRMAEKNDVRLAEIAKIHQIAKNRLKESLLTRERIPKGSFNFNFVWDNEALASDSELSSPVQFISAPSAGGLGLPLASANQTDWIWPEEVEIVALFFIIASKSANPSDRCAVYDMYNDELEIGMRKRFNSRSLKWPWGEISDLENSYLVGRENSTAIFKTPIFSSRTNTVIQSRSLTEYLQVFRRTPFESPQLVENDEVIYKNVFSKKIFLNKTLANFHCVWFPGLNDDVRHNKTVKPYSVTRPIPLQRESKKSVKKELDDLDINNERISFKGVVSVGLRSIDKKSHYHDQHGGPREEVLNGVEKSSDFFFGSRDFLRREISVKIAASDGGSVIQLPQLIRGSSGLGNGKGVNSASYPLFSIMNTVGVDHPGEFSAQSSVSVIDPKLFSAETIIPMSYQEFTAFHKELKDVMYLWEKAANTIVYSKKMCRKDRDTFIYQPIYCENSSAEDIGHIVNNENIFKKETESSQRQTPQLGGASTPASRGTRVQNKTRALSGDSYYYNTYSHGENAKECVNKEQMKNQRYLKKQPGDFIKTQEGWREWMQTITIKMMKCSRSEMLGECCKLAEINYQFLCSLFAPALLLMLIHISNLRKTLIHRIVALLEHSIDVFPRNLEISSVGTALPFGQPNTQSMSTPPLVPRSFSGPFNTINRSDIPHSMSSYSSIQELPKFHPMRCRFSTRANSEILLEDKVLAERLIQPSRNSPSISCDAREKPGLFPSVPSKNHQLPVSKEISAEINRLSIINNFLADWLYQFLLIARCNMVISEGKVAAFIEEMPMVLSSSSLSSHAPQAYNAVSPGCAVASYIQSSNKDEFLSENTNSFVPKNGLIVQDTVVKTCDSSEIFIGSSAPMVILGEIATAAHYINKNEKFLFAPLTVETVKQAVNENAVELKGIQNLDSPGLSPGAANSTIYELIEEKPIFINDFLRRENNLMKYMANIVTDVVVAQLAYIGMQTPLGVFYTEQVLRRAIEKGISASACFSTNNKRSQSSFEISLKGWGTQAQQTYLNDNLRVPSGFESIGVRSGKLNKNCFEEEIQPMYTFGSAGIRKARSGCILTENYLSESSVVPTGVSVFFEVATADRILNSFQYNTCRLTELYNLQQLPYFVRQLHLWFPLQLVIEEGIVNHREKITQDHIEAFKIFIDANTDTQTNSSSSLIFDAESCQANSFNFGRTTYSSYKDPVTQDSGLQGMQLDSAKESVDLLPIQDSSKFFSKSNIFAFVPPFDSFLNTSIFSSKECSLSLLKTELNFYSSNIIKDCFRNAFFLEGCSRFEEAVLLYLKQCIYVPAEVITRSGDPTSFGSPRIIIDSTTNRFLVLAIMRCYNRAHSYRSTVEVWVASEKLHQKNGFVRLAYNAAWHESDNCKINTMIEDCIAEEAVLAGTILADWPLVLAIVKSRLKRREPYLFNLICERIARESVKHTKKIESVRASKKSTYENIGNEEVLNEDNLEILSSSQDSCLSSSQKGDESENEDELNLLDDPVTIVDLVAKHFAGFGRVSNSEEVNVKEDGSSGNLAETFRSQKSYNDISGIPRDTSSTKGTTSVTIVLGVVGLLLSCACYVEADRLLVIVRDSLLIPTIPLLYTQGNTKNLILTSIFYRVFELSEAIEALMKLDLTSADTSYVKKVSGQQGLDGRAKKEFVRPDAVGAHAAAMRLCNIASRPHPFEDPLLNKELTVAFRSILATWIADFNYSNGDGLRVSANICNNHLQNMLLVRNELSDVGWRYEGLEEKRCKYSFITFIDSLDMKLLKDPYKAPINEGFGDDNTVISNGDYQKALTNIGQWATYDYEGAVTPETSQQGLHCVARAASSMRKNLKVLEQISTFLEKIIVFQCEVPENTSERVITDLGSCCAGLDELSGLSFDIQRIVCSPMGEKYNSDFVDTVKIILPLIESDKALEVSEKTKELISIIYCDGTKADRWRGTDEERGQLLATEILMMGVQAYFHLYKLQLFEIVEYINASGSTYSRSQNYMMSPKLIKELQMTLIDTDFLPTNSMTSFVVENPITVEAAIPIYRMAEKAVMFQPDHLGAWQEFALLLFTITHVIAYEVRKEEEAALEVKSKSQLGQVESSEDQAAPVIILSRKNLMEHARNTSEAFKKVLRFGMDKNIFANSDFSSNNLFSVDGVCKNYVVTSNTMTMTHILLKLIYITITVTGDYTGTFNLTVAPVMLWCAVSPVLVNLAATSTITKIFDHQSLKRTSESFSNESTTGKDAVNSKTTLNDSFSPVRYGSVKIVSVKGENSNEIREDSIISEEGTTLRELGDYRLEQCILGFCERSLVFLSFVVYNLIATFASANEGGQHKKHPSISASTPVLDSAGPEYEHVRAHLLTGYEERNVLLGDSIIVCNNGKCRIIRGTSAAFVDENDCDQHTFASLPTQSRSAFKDFSLNSWDRTNINHLTSVRTSADSHIQTTKVNKSRVAEPYSVKTNIKAFHRLIAGIIKLGGAHKNIILSAMTLVSFNLRNITTCEELSFSNSVNMVPSYNSGTSNVHKSKTDGTAYESSFGRRSSMETRTGERGFHPAQRGSFVPGLDTNNSATEQSFGGVRFSELQSGTVHDEPRKLNRSVLNELMVAENYCCPAPLALSELRFYYDLNGEGAQNISSVKPHPPWSRNLPKRRTSTSDRSRSGVQFSPHVSTFGLSGSGVGGFEREAASDVEQRAALAQGAGLQTDLKKIYNFNTFSTSSTSSGSDDSNEKDYINGSRQTADNTSEAFGESNTGAFGNEHFYSTEVSVGQRPRIVLRIRHRKLGHGGPNASSVKAASSNRKEELYRFKLSDGTNMDLVYQNSWSIGWKNKEAGLHRVPRDSYAEKIAPIPADARIGKISNTIKGLVHHFFGNPEGDDGENVQNLGEISVPHIAAKIDYEKLFYKLKADNMLGSDILKYISDKTSENESFISVHAFTNEQRVALKKLVLLQGKKRCTDADGSLDFHPSTSSQGVKFSYQNVQKTCGRSIPHTVLMTKSSSDRVNREVLHTSRPSAAIAEYAFSITRQMLPLKAINKTLVLPLTNVKFLTQCACAPVRIPLTVIGSLPYSFEQHYDSDEEILDEGDKFELTTYNSTGQNQQNAPRGGNIEVVFPSLHHLTVSLNKKSTEKYHEFTKKMNRRYDFPKVRLQLLPAIKASVKQAETFKNDYNHSCAVSEANPTNLDLQYIAIVNYMNNYTKKYLTSYLERHRYYRTVYEKLAKIQESVARQHHSKLSPDATLSYAVSNGVPLRVLPPSIKYISPSVSPNEKTNHPTPLPTVSEDARLLWLHDKPCADADVEATIAVFDENVKNSSCVSGDNIGVPVSAQIKDIVNVYQQVVVDIRQKILKKYNCLESSEKTLVTENCDEDSQDSRWQSNDIHGNQTLASAFVSHAASPNNYFNCRMNFTAQLAEWSALGYLFGSTSGNSGMLTPMSSDPYCSEKCSSNSNSCKEVGEENFQRKEYTAESFYRDYVTTCLTLADVRLASAGTDPFGRGVGYSGRKTHNWLNTGSIFVDTQSGAVDYIGSGTNSMLPYHRYAERRRVNKRSTQDQLIETMALHPAGNSFFYLSGKRSENESRDSIEMDPSVEILLKCFNEGYFPVFPMSTADTILRRVFLPPSPMTQLHNRRFTIGTEQLCQAQRCFQGNEKKLEQSKLCSVKTDEFNISEFLELLQLQQKPAPVEPCALRLSPILLEALPMGNPLSAFAGYMTRTLERITFNTISNDSRPSGLERTDGQRASNVRNRTYYRHIIGYTHFSHALMRLLPKVQTLRQLQRDLDNSFAADGYTNLYQPVSLRKQPGMGWRNAAGETRMLQSTPTSEGNSPCAPQSNVVEFSPHLINNATPPQRTLIDTSQVARHVEITSDVSHEPVAGRSMFDIKFFTQRIIGMPLRESREMIPFSLLINEKKGKCLIETMYQQILREHEAKSSVTQSEKNKGEKSHDKQYFNILAESDRKGDDEYSKNTLSIEDFEPIAPLPRTIDQLVAQLIFLSTDIFTNERQHIGSAVGVLNMEYAEGTCYKLWSAWGPQC